MQKDNMDDNDMIPLLTRYMDGELAGEEAKKIEELLREDSAIQSRYENLLLAKNTIATIGLRQKVAGLQQEYLNELAATKKVAKVPFIKYVTRIAAILLPAFLLYGSYEFFSTNKDKVFRDHFIAYYIPATRGDHENALIDSLYRKQDFKATEEAISTKALKTPKDYFLLAQVYLQNNEIKKAIENFKELEKINMGEEKYFAEETDYYLMLAYIKDGNIDAAEKLLTKMRGNTRHMFYLNVKDISNIALTILKWKS